jgi:hypothetical protein
MNQLSFYMEALVVQGAALALVPVVSNVGAEPPYCILSAATCMTALG